MASPTRTWTSILLALVIVYFLFLNLTQLFDLGRALTSPIASKMMGIAQSTDADKYLGLPGIGALLLLYGIAAMSMFLNKQEKPNFTRSQLIAFIMIGVLLGVAFLSCAMAFVETHLKNPKPEGVLIAEMVLAGFRLLVMGGIIGCSVHVLKNN